MLQTVPRQHGFATIQIIGLIAVIVVILIVGGFVLNKQKPINTKSSNLSGSISCSITSNVATFTTKTNSFRIIYNITNNSNQQVESKWYLSDIVTSPQEGDITSSLAPGGTKIVSVDYSGAPTKAFSAVIGAYANGGTVPGSGANTCKQVWQVQ